MYCGPLIDIVYSRGLKCLLNIVIVCVGSWCTSRSSLYKKLLHLIFLSKLSFYILAIRVGIRFAVVAWGFTKPLPRSLLIPGLLALHNHVLVPPIHIN